MKIAHDARNVKCSSHPTTARYETGSHNVKTSWKCTNPKDEPRPLKKLMLFGPGMNVTEQNKRRGNLSDDGVNIKVSFNRKIGKKDEKILHFKEFKDYCVSSFIYLENCNNCHFHDTIILMLYDI